MSLTSTLISYFLSLDATCIAFIESPPISKKLSFILTLSNPKTDPITATNCS
ncbi:hypothetical protein JQ038_15950 [Clostridium botulinum]|nr:hypothetical protein [Clostridium botulinum]MCS4483381.1 hypothetical protein [Clostridium botulinum]